MNLTMHNIIYHYSFLFSKYLPYKLIWESCYTANYYL